MLSRLFTVMLSALSLGACSSVTVTAHADFGPSIALEDFFQGDLVAHGVIKNRGGKIIRTFSATIEASWQGGVGTLDEDFLFDDGERDKRVWTLTPQENGEYTGTAGDVVGPGQLTLAGNSVFLDYTLRIPYGDGTIDVRVDDRMYRVSEDLLINESAMKKFGLRVGSILLVIQRLDQPYQLAAAQ